MRVLGLLLLVASPSLAQGVIPLDDARWQFAGDSTRVERANGRDAIRMYTGTATRRDLRLQDGTIDVDVLMTKRRSFVYVRFRMEDEENAEEFYIRPHKSELPDAVQYAPVFHGQSAWQLYHGERGTASPAIETGVWTRVRVVLQGQRMAVFLGDTTRPVLDVPLARAPREGYVQLAAFLPAGTPGAGAIAWFANMRVRPGVVPYAFPAMKAAPLQSGVISRWSVGSAFVTTNVEPAAIKAEWLAGARAVDIEPNGMVALNRWLVSPAGRDPAVRSDMATVARVRIVAERDVVRPLQLGFSDAVTVFLNGRPLFHGDDSYLFPQRRDGLIGFDQATVYLPLKAGRNDVSLVVTDHFGGWGLMGRLPDMTGLRVELP